MPDELVIPSPADFARLTHARRLAVDARRAAEARRLDLVGLAYRHDFGSVAVARTYIPPRLPASSGGFGAAHGVPAQRPPVPLSDRIADTRRRLLHNPAWS